MMMHFPEHFQKSLRFFDFWKIEIEKLKKKMKKSKKVEKIEKLKTQKCWSKSEKIPKYCLELLKPLYSGSKP